MCTYLRALTHSLHTHARIVCPPIVALFARLPCPPPAAEHARTQARTHSATNARTHATRGMHARKLARKVPRTHARMHSAPCDCVIFSPRQVPVPSFLGEYVSTCTHVSDDNSKANQQLERTSSGLSSVWGRSRHLPAFRAGRVECTSSFFFCQCVRTGTLDSPPDSDLPAASGRGHGDTEWLRVPF